MQFFHPFSDLNATAYIGRLLRGIGGKQALVVRSLHQLAYTAEWTTMKEPGVSSISQLFTSSQLF
jgi:hypothetical protein